MRYVESFVGNTIEEIVIQINDFVKRNGYELISVQYTANNELLSFTAIIVYEYNIFEC